MRRQMEFLTSTFSDDFVFCVCDFCVYLLGREVWCSNRLEAEVVVLSGKDSQEAGLTPGRRRWEPVKGGASARPTTLKVRLLNYPSALVFLKKSRRCWGSTSVWTLMRNRRMTTRWKMKTSLLLWRRSLIFLGSNGRSTFDPVGS